MHPGLSTQFGRESARFTWMYVSNICRVSRQAQIWTILKYLEIETFDMNVACKGMLDPSVKICYLVNCSHQGLERSFYIMHTYIGMIYLACQQKTFLVRSQRYSAEAYTYVYE